MRVAVTSTGPSLDAPVDPRFGRCPYFLLVETDDMSFKAVANENSALGGGAGIQSARLVVQEGARTVLTGNCGPNAHEALSAAGVEVVVGCSGTVSEVAERFKAGELRAVPAPNVAPHSGMGGGQG
jgi:predicted Fe-Mo cluster-binding NifX family protein